MGPLTEAAPPSRRETVVASVSACVAFPLWFYLQFSGYIERITTSIPGGEGPRGTETAAGFWGGDHIQLFYLAWKLRRQLLSGVAVFSDPFTFAARTGVLWDVEVAPQYWLINLFTALLGPTVGYNLGFIIAPPVLTFIGAYWLVRGLSPSRLLAVGLAVSLAVLPMRMQQLFGGHGGGAVMALLPWYWGAVLRRRLREDDRRSDAWAGALLVMIALGDLHQGYYCLLVSGLVFGAWGVQDGWFTGRERLLLCVKRWKFLLLGLLVIIGHAAVIRRVQLTGTDGNLSAHPLDSVRSFSRPLSDFMGGDANVGSLLLASLLVTGSLFMATRGLRAALRSPWIGFVAALLVCLLILPGVGDSPSQQIGFYALCYRFLPFFAAQRVPGKIFSTLAVILVVLAPALFEAARRAPDLSRRFVRGALLSAALLQPLVFMGFFHREWPGVRLSDMRWGPRNIIAYLEAHMTPDDIVLDVPFVPYQEPRYATLPLYLATQTGVRFASGYYGFIPQHVVDVGTRISAFNGGQVSPDNVALARSLGYKFVLYDRSPGEAPRTPAQAVLRLFNESPLLERVMCEDDFCLYRFRASGS